MLTVDDFLRYGKYGFNLVPLWKCIELTDISPLAAYRCLANQRHDYLFETGCYRNECFERKYSIIGLPCEDRIELSGNRIRVLHHDSIVREELSPDPLGALQQMLAETRVPSFDMLPDYSGGLFGYFGFETARMIEPRLTRQSRKPAALELPDVVQLISKELVVFDHAQKKIFCIVHAAPNGKDDYQCAVSKLDRIAKILDELPAETWSAKPVAPASTNAPGKMFEFRFPRDAFEASVDKIKDYIKAGDVMQAVLSQQMTRPLQADALDFYHALTEINQSPYSYIVNVDGRQIVGASPEMLVRHQGGRVVSRPMAGTRRRGANVLEDWALQAELLADPKEVAEHMMLVDLARNDLGRIADIGSVTVDQTMEVERFSHVMHIVSTVTGRRTTQIDAIDVLKSTFPAGTLSGASKIRAMEIINELEPYSRGVYGGAIGHIGWKGDIDLAIAIRTGVISDGRLHLQAGAGIVLDSQPEREWQETIEKIRALVLAADRAELTQRTVVSCQTTKENLKCTL